MGNSLEQALKRCDFGGAHAPPFCAVGRLSAPFNASSACWKGLSIRHQEVFKGFGRRKPDSYQAHSNSLIFSELYYFHTPSHAPHCGFCIWPSCSLKAPISSKISKKLIER